MPLEAQPGCRSKPTIEFGAASSANITFDAGATGTLKLSDSFDFSGIVSGFNQHDHIDLVDMRRPSRLISRQHPRASETAAMRPRIGTRAKP
jgi:hypothetical protein